MKKLLFAFLCAVLCTNGLFAQTNTKVSKERQLLSKWGIKPTKFGQLDSVEATLRRSLNDSSLIEESEQLKKGNYYTGRTAIAQNIVFLDFDRDGFLDFITIEFPILEGNLHEFWWFNPSTEKYTKVFELIGNIENIVELNEQKTLCFTFEINGCCEDYVSHYETYAVNRAGGTPSFTSLGNEVEFFHNIPKKTISRQGFKLKETSWMTVKPVEKAKPSDEDGEDGNCVALYPKDSRGVILAETTFQGEIWYCVEMLNNLKANSLQNTIKAQTPRLTRGWFPEKYLKKIKSPF